nr:PREDICTED: uncharacterized protein LOC108223910 isoform X1 [Daucus carota subsp. sativus]
MVELQSNQSYVRWLQVAVPPSSTCTLTHNMTHDTAETSTTDHLAWPFGSPIDGLDPDDLSMAAYEIFFTSCRSSPGFGGRTTLSFHSSSTDFDKPGSPVKGSGVGMAVTSRVKRALGLKMMRRSLTSRRTNSWGSYPDSPRASPRAHDGSGSPVFSHSLTQPRQRRPLTSAEIMRQQMRVTEHSDNRLRKTLMRTLVGQMGRRAETIILPLELLRHLKPAEFNNPVEYHVWQKRQLKLLEAGLLLYPSSPVEKTNEFAIRLRETIHSCESKPLDTGKNSDQMKTLCNDVVALAWRSPDGSATDVCHWADGYPFNIRLYTALLHSIFDLKDNTCVLDEVDELLELMKKTWSTLGIDRSIHNLCFTWVLFEQYIETGKVETDLLGASLAMLAEVANDAKRVDRQPIYVKMLGQALNSMKKWCDKRMLDYHANIDMEDTGLMESILPLVSSATRILEEDVPGYTATSQENDDGTSSEFSGNRVDMYIRSSLRHAFTKMLDDGNVNVDVVEVEEAGETLLQIAQATEELAILEKENYSHVLKKWHPIPAGVAAVTLHTCYGTLLKQYLSDSCSLTHETLKVLQRAGKLEKALVQMVVEDSVESEDGGKTIVREMEPYEVESIILKSVKHWVQERLKVGNELLQKSKETETWNPKSKNEPYAQSAADLVKHTKIALDEFFEIPIPVPEDLVNDIAEGLENLLQEYTKFVSSCGSKQSYIPTLPPLTRCNRDSKFFKLWKKAAPCTAPTDNPFGTGSTLPGEEGNPRPSTSRGTQRLYIRLNTLHYLLSQLHIFDKILTLSPKIVPSPNNRFTNRSHQLGNSYFDETRTAIQSATQHVSEVAAYRLIFLDSNSAFYGSVYVHDVENARIKPAVKILKQNLTLLGAIVTERIQPLAIKEVMKASFDVFLMILLAGGGSRAFNRQEHPMIEEDFDSLKKVFSTVGEGLLAEDVVDKEAETVEGVVALMGQSTEQLVEDFSIVSTETNGASPAGAGQKLPIPPTTGRWSRADPNTILRVLCHRNDQAANNYLKRTFQLSKRR